MLLGFVLLTAQTHAEAKNTTKRDNLASIARTVGLINRTLSTHRHGSGEYTRWGHMTLTDDGYVVVQELWSKHTAPRRTRYRAHVSHIAPVDPERLTVSIPLSCKESEFNCWTELDEDARQWNRVPLKMGYYKEVGPDSAFAEGQYVSSTMS